MGIQLSSNNSRNFGRPIRIDGGGVWILDRESRPSRIGNEYFERFISYDNIRSFQIDPESWISKRSRELLMFICGVALIFPLYCGIQLGVLAVLGPMLAGGAIYSFFFFPPGVHIRVATSQGTRSVMMNAKDWSEKGSGIIALIASSGCDFQNNVF